MVLVQKWRFFQLFFLGNIGQENIFYDILERKNAFLGYEKKKFKKSKNCLSPKVFAFFLPFGMVFVWKWLFLQRFFLGNIGQENVFHDILEQKKAFVGYKNNKFKKVEKLTFFQRG